VADQLASGYRSLLVAIQENPFGTIAELAEKSGISKPTAAKRIRQLQAKRIFMVKPLLNNRVLGFDFVDLFLESSDIESVKRIEKIADKHPYTSYLGRCFGAVNGVLLQFRTPFGTKPLIVDLAKNLVDDGIVTNYRIVPIENGASVYSSLSVKGWDPRTLSWKFNWEEWFTKESKKLNLTQPTEELGSALTWFEEKDVHILYEAMHDARKKNLDILKALDKQGINITPQTFSRRYQMIKEQCFDGYRVTFNSSIFDIYNNLVIVGKGKPDCIKGIQSKIISNPIPFQSAMRSSGSNIFWFIRLQSSHLSALLSNLHTCLDSLEVSLIDLSHSYSYFVWPGNYNAENHSWRAEKEFMVDDVLN